MYYLLFNTMTMAKMKIAAIPITATCCIGSRMNSPGGGVVVVVVVVLDVVVGTSKIV